MKVESKQKRDEFKLRVSGVAIGKYEYSIACDKLFFEIAGVSELMDGVINLHILMQIDEKMITLKFIFNGTATAPCDRCLDPVNLNFDFQEQLVVNLVPVVDEIENDDNIWFVDENIYELDVFHFVYECITLALPHRIVHPDDENGHSTCNPEVLETLQKLSTKENDGSIDPRWDALKNIKFDD